MHHARITLQWRLYLGRARCHISSAHLCPQVILPAAGGPPGNLLGTNLVFVQPDGMIAPLLKHAYIAANVPAGGNRPSLQKGSPDQPGYLTAVAPPQVNPTPPGAKPTFHIETAIWQLGPSRELTSVWINPDGSK